MAPRWVYNTLLPNYSFPSRCHFQNVTSLTPYSFLYLISYTFHSQSIYCLMSFSYSFLRQSLLPLMPLILLSDFMIAKSKEYFMTLVCFLYSPQILLSWFSYVYGNPSAFCFYDHINVAIFGLSCSQSILPNLELTHLCNNLKPCLYIRLLSWALILLHIMTWTSQKFINVLKLASSSVVISPNMILLINLLALKHPRFLHFPYHSHKALSYFISLQNDNRNFSSADIC